MSELGCLLMVGIPAQPLRVAQRLSWVRVSYWAKGQITHGITAEPGLDPPIG